MIRSLEKMYSSVLPKKEEFNDNKLQTLPLFLALVTTQILILIFGKYLWNNYLVKYVSIVSPVESIIDVLAISILLSLMIPH